MNYDQFRTLFEEALRAARMMRPFSRREETISLGGMSRAYETRVALGTQSPPPFYVTATLCWKWDAALSARFATTEEDLLTEILGRDGSYLVTERPWLRVDVKLNASLPWGEPLPMPASDAWQRWASEVVARLSPLLPADSEEVEGELQVLSWCGEPEAEVQCGTDGRLFVTGVYLSAWQGIDLPRQWDNPDRAPDPWPDEQLDDLAERLRQALVEWEYCLQYLPTAASDRQRR